METDSYSENRLTAVRGRGIGGLGEKCKRIKQKKRKETRRLTDTENSVVTTGEKRGGGSKRGKGE